MYTCRQLLFKAVEGEGENSFSVIYSECLAILFALAFMIYSLSDSSFYIQEQREDCTQTGP